MRQLLEDEVVAFTPEGRVDLKRYGWDPTLDLTEERRAELFPQAERQPEPVSDTPMRPLLDDPAPPLPIPHAAEPHTCAEHRPPHPLSPPAFSRPSLAPP